MSYCVPPQKTTYKISMLKTAPSLVLWGLLGGVTVTAPRIEKSPRPHRQGVGACHGFAVPPTDLSGGDPAGPPVLGFASPDRPPLGTSPPLPAAAAPPVGSPVRRVLFQKALAPGPAGQRTARSGGRFACKSFDATATAQRAECLLRSTTRGPARSKVSCARHAAGVASGHSLASV